MTHVLTDTQIIAKAVTELAKRGHVDNFRDIFVERQRRTFWTKKPGWRVFFAFVEPDCFGSEGISYEVDEDGEVTLFESM